MIGGALLLAACSSDDTQAGSGGFRITVSGEALATTGYSFRPNSSIDDDPPSFVDGWDVRFEHVIVTVGHIHLNASPDLDPADPTHVGPEVARVPGVFAVDATIGGSIAGKSGDADEKTVEIATVSGRFDPAARYAFGYDLVAASPSASLVNLDDAGKALYEKAKANGWSMIYAGTATYAGPPPDGVFASLPKTVKFELGFANPSSYLNCENTDLVGNPRGVQASVDAPTTVQITIHTDHAFWSKLNVEGTELHFDPIAARAKDGVVTTADLVDADITAFSVDARSYVSGYSPAPGKLSYDANGTTFTKPNSFAAYLAYSAASGGHLNADGECVVRNAFVP